MATNCEWSILEKLLLTQAVYKYGENMWFQVARVLKQHGLIQPQQRQSDFFSQKNCQFQYYLLVENLEAEKQVYRNNDPLKNDMPVVVRIARQLYLQRIEQVKEELKKDEADFGQLAEEINSIKSGKWDERLQEDGPSTENKSLNNILQQEHCMKRTSSETNMTIGSSLKRCRLEDQMDSEDQVISTAIPNPIVEISTLHPEIAAKDSIEQVVEPSDQTVSVTKESIEQTVTAATEPIAQLASITMEPAEQPAFATMEPTVPLAAITMELTEQPATITMEPTVPLAAITMELTEQPASVTMELIEQPASVTMELTEQPVSVTMEPIKQVSAATLPILSNLHESDINTDAITVTDTIVTPDATLATTSDETPATSSDDTPAITTINGTINNPDDIIMHATGLSTETIINPVQEIEETPEETVSSPTGYRQQDQKGDKPRIIIPEASTYHQSGSPISKLHMTPDDEYFTSSETATPTSARRLNSNSDQRQKSWQKNINLLWQEIANHKNGTMFMNPIKKSYAPLYDKVVKQPLYLKTIKNRVKDGIVKTTDEFERDVVLMLTNSLMYNKEGTEMYLMALEMLDDVREQIRLFKSADGFSVSLWENDSQQ